MRWKKQDIGIVGMSILTIFVMLGLCNQLLFEKTVKNSCGVWSEGALSDGVACESEEKRIALTFDDGPNGVYTERLLDGLAERDIKVTFFLIGKYAEQYPELVERMADEGHMIGNHTYSHLQLTGGNVEAFLEEIECTNEIIENITGERPMFCRPPFGSWSQSVEEITGIIPVLWDVDPKDWCTMDAQTVAARVLAQCHDNGIILLHDEYESSIEAAFMVIDELVRQGYTFVTVDEVVINP